MATSRLRQNRDELALVNQDLTIQEARCRHQNLQIQELEEAVKEDRRRYDELLEEATESLSETAGQDKVRSVFDRLKEVNGRIKEIQAHVLTAIIPAIANSKTGLMARQHAGLYKLHDLILRQRSESTKAMDRCLKIVRNENKTMRQKGKELEAAVIERDQCTLKLRKCNVKILTIKSQVERVLPALQQNHDDNLKVTLIVQEMGLLLQKFLRDQRKSRQMTEKLQVRLVQKRTLTGTLMETVRDRDENVSRSLTETDELKMKLNSTISQLADQIVVIRSSNVNIRNKIENRLGVETMRRMDAGGSLTETNELRTKLYETVSQIKDRLTAVQSSSVRVRMELEDRLAAGRLRENKTAEFLDDVKKKYALSIKAQQQINKRLVEEYESSRLQKMQLNAKVKASINQFAENAGNVMARQKLVLARTHQHYQRYQAQNNDSWAIESKRNEQMMEELAILKARLRERVPLEQHRKLGETSSKMLGKMQDQQDTTRAEKAKIEYIKAAATRAIEFSRAYNKKNAQMIRTLAQANAARSARMESSLSAAWNESHRSQAEMKEHLAVLGGKFEAQKSEIVRLKEQLSSANSLPTENQTKELDHARRQLRDALERIHKNALHHKQLWIVLKAVANGIAKSSAKKQALKQQLVRLSTSLQNARRSGSEGRETAESMALHCKLERTDLLAEVIGLQDDNKHIRALMAQQHSTGQQLSIPIRTAPVDRLFVGEARHALASLLTAYKGKCKQLGTLKEEQERMRSLIPQMASMAKEQLTINCSRQAAIIEHTRIAKQQLASNHHQEPPLLLDANGDAVRLIIEDLAEELAETQEELRRALELCRVKLVEDMSSRRVDRNIAEKEFDGLCRLNEIERSRSTIPHHI
jgi:hypothetical protein